MADGHIATGLKELGVSSLLLEAGLVRRDGRIAEALGVAMEDLRVEVTPSRRSGDR